MVAYSVNSGLQLTIIVLWLFSSDGIGKAETVEMRIVEESTSYTWQQNMQQSRDVTLQMRVNPSPFSGPEQLRRLSRKCFTKTIEKYEYVYCPFRNVTQKEVNTNTWNPYQGILGVWQEWKITDNHFVSMMMLMGDQCGTQSRKVEVTLTCGPQNEILNVTEPRHCEYALEFSTPLACHEHSMLVYPTLSADLQSQWNRLYSELNADEITVKGYGKALHGIFQEAGYILKSHSDSSPLDGNTEAHTQTNDSTSRFSTLETCSKAYESLSKELEETKAQLQRFH